MCTELKKEKSFFMPFNKGNNNGAGNPRNPNGLKTDYLWKDILTKPCLSNILENYVQITEEKDEDTGRKSYKQIFPRYHQLSVVTSLLADAKNDGPGHRYLIQHSAGSGKSNSIAWLAHQLVTLKKDKKDVFDTVIVVTDRVNLDKQIRDTIKQFMQVSSTVGWAKDASTLSTLMEQGKKIIITIVHKFQFILDAVSADYKNKKFAIIIDEAHSSQNGSLAAKMNIAVSGNVYDDDDEFEDKLNTITAICLLIGGLYLIIRKVISPIIPLVYIGTFSVFIFLYSLASGMGFEPLYLAAHLCGGGLMLGAFFMATDYVTSPITKKGKVVFGIILGLLTFLFRIYGGSAEGVSYAIIISNLLVPLIERFTQPKSFGKGAELQKEEGGSAADGKKMDKKSIVIATVAILVITLVAGGVLAYVQQITKKPIEQAEQQAKEDAYREVFTDADAFRTVDGFDSETASAWLSDKGYKADIDEAVTACDKDGNALGYVFVITSHEAYGGDLQLALGVAEDGTTNGISFLSLSETAGLGMQADTDEFKSQFAGKNVAQFKYTKSGAASDEEIDALSGATITTNAVTNAVNAGLSYADYLKGGAN